MGGMRVEGGTVSNQLKAAKMIYYVDGFTIGRNPSRQGGGFTVVDENGELIHRQEYRRYFTNNEGELRGVQYACEDAEEGSIVATDSQVAVFWCRNGKSKARPDLNRVCANVKELIALKGLELVWVRRDKNLAGIHNEGVTHKGVCLRPFGR